MWGIGFFEVVLLFVLMLLVLGPQRMMLLARYGGLFVRKARVLYAQVVDEIDQQLRLDEMAQHNAKFTKAKKAKPSEKKTEQ